MIGMYISTLRRHSLSCRTNCNFGATLVLVVATAERWLHAPGRESTSGSYLRLAKIKPIKKVSDLLHEEKAVDEPAGDITHDIAMTYIPLLFLSFVI